MSSSIAQASGVAVGSSSISSSGGGGPLPARTAAATIASMGAALRTLDRVLTAAEGKVGELEAGLADKGREVDSLAAALQGLCIASGSAVEARSAAAGLAGEAERIKHELPAARAQVAAQVAESEALRTAIAAAEAALREARELRRVGEAAVSDAEAQRARVAGALTAALGQRDSASQQLARAGTEREELEARLKEARGAKTAAEDAVRAAMEAAHAAVEALPAARSLQTEEEGQLVRLRGTRSTLQGHLESGTLADGVLRF